ncbi:MAG: hypothetical protein WA364_08365 [Candidatus Nitrosopolaris sp.]|jgi:hypothetical protein
MIEDNKSPLCILNTRKYKTLVQNSLDGRQDDKSIPHIYNMNALYSKRMKDRNNWTSSFIKATIIQMMLASVLTLFFVLALHGPLRLLSFLIAYDASDAPFAGAWFNFGFITYLIGVLAIGMMAMIYTYFEHTLHIGYDRATRVLAALNFILMNAGIIIATWPMMIAGYIAGVSEISSEFGGKGIPVHQIHLSIFVPLGITIWVPVGILATALGVILGCIGFFVNLTRNREI